MFHKYENGSQEDIQGIICNIPPVGFIENWRTGGLVKVPIYKRHKFEKECYWEADPRWGMYKEWQKEEKKKRDAGNDNFVHPELAKFINDCFLYRRGGFWFYNNGVPTYITGTHWYYLSVFHLDIGLPQYRDVDRQFFYVWKYCEEDDLCYGLAYLTKRRNGKCLGFNTPIRMYDGSIKMVQDIVDGDIVMGVNSQPRIAYGITQGREQMYKVYYEDGFFTCNKSHIVSLKNKENEVLNISVINILEDWDNIYKDWFIYNDKGETFSWRIEYIGIGDYYGFAVDGDHLFLLGDGIVTHNTYQAGCIGLEQVTRIKKFNFGIQSKTEKDARDVFRKAAVSPYRTLPYFFQPKISKMAQTGKLAEKEMRFIGNKDEDIELELDSKADYMPSNEGAYDGQKLGYFLADEVAKEQTCDINERWGTVKKCLTDFTGRVIGKTLHTTTVEDMGGKAGKAFLQMWQNSNQLEKTKGGRTKTGLYRFFVSGAKVRCLDKYGYADEVLGLEQIMDDRDAAKDNSRTLSKTIRQDPLNDKEAFMTDSDKCVFNPMILNEREQELVWHKGEPLYKRGNWAWVDEDYGDVKFVENPNGQIYLMEDVPEEIRNRQGDRYGFKIPMNSHIYSMGVDTYDHKIIITSENEKVLSKGSFSVIKKPTDSYSTDMDNGLVCYFKHRYENPEHFYRDVIMTMIYFGCEALIERNKPALINYATKLGLELYCTIIEGQTQRGIHTSDITNTNIAELTDQYITDHCKKVNVLEVIDEWKEFDPSDTTVFDGAMSFGLALIQWDKKKPKKTTKSKISEISQIFDANDMLGAVKLGGIDTDLKFT